jgi:hypothetical protein
MANDLEEEEKYLSMDYENIYYSLAFKPCSTIVSTYLSSILSPNTILSKISLIIESDANNFIDLEDLTNIHTDILLSGSYYKQINLFDKLIIDKLLNLNDIDTTSQLNYLELEILDETQGKNNFLFICNHLSLVTSYKNIKSNKYSFKYKITCYKNKKQTDGFINKTIETCIQKPIIQSQKEFGQITKSSQKIRLNFNHPIPIILVVLDSYIIPEKFIFELDDSKITFGLGDWEEYVAGQKTIYFLTFDEQFKELDNLKKFFNQELESKDFVSINFSRIDYSYLKIQTRTNLDYDVSVIGYNINWLATMSGLYGLRYSC